MSTKREASSDQTSTEAVKGENYHHDDFDFTHFPHNLQSPPEQSALDPFDPPNKEGTTIGKSQTLQNPIQEEQSVGTNVWTTVGTLVVIGAMATNVFGFKYSRWAVGKDIHRAWERHQRQATSGNSESQRRVAEELRRRQATYARAGRQPKQQTRHRAEKDASNRDRAERERVRTRYSQWEGRSEGGQGFFRAEFRSEFGPRNFQELLRHFEQANKTGFGAGGRGFGLDDQTVEELLRAAKELRQEGGQTRREQGSDSFRFWQAMNEKEWGDFSRNSSGGGGGMQQRAGMSRFYRALGVQEGASEDDVKKAYRKEVMKWHPDRYKGRDKTEAARKFREVTEAYSTLTNKK